MAALELLARQERTTLFTAALAVFYLWLHRLTGQYDLAVGSMFANRLRAETIGTVGLLREPGGAAYSGPGGGNVP